jgi:hypothetical protein
MNKFKPDGWPTVTPRIFTDDVARLVGFLKIVFGASGRLQSGAPTELRIGDSVVLISDGGGAREAMPMSKMRTRPTSEHLPQALNRSKDLGTCLTATDERRFGIRGGTSGRSRHTAGAETIAHLRSNSTHRVEATYP